MNLKNDLDHDDKAFLLQFVTNCDDAGVLWQVGRIGGPSSSGPEYVVKALVNSEICSGRAPRLHVAIKKCVSAALPTGKLTI